MGSRRVSKIADARPYDRRIGFRQHRSLSDGSETDAFGFMFGDDLDQILHRVAKRSSTQTVRVSPSRA
uniref:Uncharacterized protein n=1 Tax=Rhizobium rhizogenes TaxID=359 RepID=A0A7S5DQS6_RHIRH|nr:hypothetical protein pC5.7d_633 [Rhizobium rhizogenes]